MHKTENCRIVAQQIITQDLHHFVLFTVLFKGRYFYLEPKIELKLEVLSRDYF